MAKNMTVTAPIRHGDDPHFVEMKLTENPEKNRYITDLLNEISSVAVLMNQPEDVFNNDNAGEISENIRNYNEFVEQVNELKYLFNCELTNKIEVYNPERQNENLEEIKHYIWNSYLERRADREYEIHREYGENRNYNEIKDSDRGFDELDTLKEILRSEANLGRELEWISSENPVITEISLFYILMCRYGGEMQNYFRLSLLLNFYQSSPEYERDIFYRNIRELQLFGYYDLDGMRRAFNRYCGHIDSYYSNLMYNTHVEHIRKGTFKNLDVVKNLVGVLGRIGTEWTNTHGGPPPTDRYINGGGNAGCFAILELGSDLYAALSGIGVPDFNSIYNKIKKQPSFKCVFKDIFTKAPDSIRYYYNPYNYITFGQYKRFNSINTEYDRMFSCAERKFIVYENIPELFHVIGLSATMYVRMYPCYMCKFDLEAMERYYLNSFTIKTYDKNKLIRKSPSSLLMAYDTKRSVFDQKAIEVVADLLTPQP